jgi:CRP-like cAMP-binding protein
MVDPTLLDPLPLLAGLEPAARSALAAGAVQGRVANGAALFRAGEEARGIYLVLDGTVRVVGHRGGRQHLIHVEGPGGSLGEVPFFAGGGFPATALADGPVRYLFLDRAAITAAIRLDPTLAWRLLRHMSTRVRELVGRLERNTAWSVQGRLAEVLIRRHAAAGGAAFTLGQTQAALAEELGTVREVVVRTLAALREDGLIRNVGRGRYAVRDERGLRAMVTSVPSEPGGPD